MADSAQRKSVFQLQIEAASNLAYTALAPIGNPLTGGGDVLKFTNRQAIPSSTPSSLGSQSVCLLLHGRKRATSAIRKMVKVIRKVALSIGGCEI